MAARSPGSFSLNAYGYLTQANITTTGGLTLPGTTYNLSTIGTYSNIIPTAPPADGIDLFVGYNQVLQILFQNSSKYRARIRLLLELAGRPSSVTPFHALPEALMESIRAISRREWLQHLCRRLGLC